MDDAYGDDHEYYEDGGDLEYYDQDAYDEDSGYQDEYYEEGSNEDYTKDETPSREISDDYYIAPEDELLMHTWNTLPQKVKKFWAKRYDLFSRYDEGIYMNTELWYSVTPEAAARYIALLTKSMLPKASKILDLCCGGGGNTIQFAEYFDNVGAIDINQVHIQCTMHNAGIYGVQNKIWSCTGDWNKMTSEGSQDWIPEDMRNALSPKDVFDFIFCSPPWGGPSYTREANSFDLLNMEPFAIDTLLKQMALYSRNMALFLPRNSNMDQIRQVTRDLFGKDAKCRAVLLSTDGHQLGMAVFFGPDVTLERDYHVVMEDGIPEML